MKNTKNEIEELKSIYEMIGKKWNLLIIKILLEKRMRFTEIRNEIPKLSDRILTERLRELEIHNIVKRIVYARIPVKVEYELTKKGKSLNKIIYELAMYTVNTDEYNQYYNEETKDNIRKLFKEKLNIK